jgi:hypothetical protein
MTKLLQQAEPAAGSARALCGSPQVRSDFSNRFRRIPVLLGFALAQVIQQHVVLKQVENIGMCPLHLFGRYEIHHLEPVTGHALPVMSILHASETVDVFFPQGIAKTMMGLDKLGADWLEGGLCVPDKDFAFELCGFRVV